MASRREMKTLLSKSIAERLTERRLRHLSAILDYQIISIDRKSDIKQLADLHRAVYIIDGNANRSQAFLTSLKAHSQALLVYNSQDESIAYHIKHHVKIEHPYILVKGFSSLHATISRMLLWRFTQPHNLDSLLFTGWGSYEKTFHILHNDLQDQLAKFCKAMLCQAEVQTQVMTFTNQLITAQPQFGYEITRCSVATDGVLFNQKISLRLTNLAESFDQLRDSLMTLPIYALIISQAPETGIITCNLLTPMRLVGHRRIQQLHYYAQLTTLEQLALPKVIKEVS